MKKYQVIAYFGEGSIVAVKVDARSKYEAIEKGSQYIGTDANDADLKDIKAEEIKGK